MKKGRVKNLILLLVSLGCALVLAEVGVRIFYPWPFYSRGMTVKFHRVIGWTFMPDLDTHSTNQQREYIRPFRTNSLGFRDGEPKPTGPGGAFVGLGDSFTVAREVPAKKRWTETLARMISAYRGRRVKSLNFGCDAYSPTQEWLAYKLFAGEYPHKLVILLFYTGNDFADVLGNANTPFLKPTSKGYVLVTPKDPELIVKRWGGRPKWYKRFHLYNLQRDLMAGWRIKGKWEKRRKMWDGTWDGFWRVYKGAFTIINRIYKPPPNELYKKSAPLLTESFRRLSDLVKKAGRKLVVFIMPERRAYGDRRGASDRMAPGMGKILKRIDLDLPQRMAKKILAKLGIEHFDLTPLLRKLGRGARTFNFPWDTHLKASGQKFIARVMFDFLRRKGILDQCGLGPSSMAIKNGHRR